MKAEKQTKAVGEPKGVKPDMRGVAGCLIEATDAPEGLLFWHRKKVSPYDALLESLAAAGQGKMLRFEDRRARVSIGVRAKKLGLRVVCAEADGKLYVRFESRVEDNLKGTRRGAILGALKPGIALTAMEITVLLRDKGDGTVDAGLVGTILDQMVRSGQIVACDGGNYAINPKALKVGT
jgi:hypothetical protein